MATGFSSAALILQRQALKSCFLLQFGNGHLAQPQHRFWCWNDKIAVLCYVEEEQCRSLQLCQYKKHKYERFLEDRESSSMSTLTISNTFRKGRRGSLR